MKIAIYLDMDGVLADFNRGKDTILGGKFELNKRLGDLSPELVEYKSQLYRSIEKDLDFYYNLHPMEDALELYEGVRQYSPLILTAAPGFESKSEESFLNVAKKKMHWCRLHLNHDENRFICTLSHLKTKFLGVVEADLHILIDDRKDNCKDWEDAGGKALLHRSANESLAMLEDIVKSRSSFRVQQKAL